jgi:capsule polysaccharide export protein KpsE/RkpR
MAARSEPIPGIAECDAQFVCVPSEGPNWVHNLRILWNCRRPLAKMTCAALACNLLIALIIPKSYVSQARIMPPESGTSNSAIMAALASRSLGDGLLGGLAANLMGGHSTGALFVDLLRSSSVAGRLIDRFDLQHVYGKRYREDAAKVLARRTTIAQDKKSGVLTITVKDHDPRRARDMVQAYLDGLNAVVNRTSTSSAHQERVFIEARLAAVRTQLERAQEALSEFSSTHSTIDLREQARATVESQGRLQGELIAAEGELESLRQVYVDGSPGLRSAEVRVSLLKRELDKMGGSAAPLSDSSNGQSGLTQLPNDGQQPYLPLRQVPRLGVPYADLYREVHVQETVYGLLTQQYEIARIQEAKDVPAVNVIDAPGIPEKKSFPPRTVLTLCMTLVMFLSFCSFLIMSERWRVVDADDPRRVLASEIAQVAAARISGTMRRIRRSA